MTLPSYDRNVSVEARIGDNQGLQLQDGDFSSLGGIIKICQRRLMPS